MSKRKPFEPLSGYEYGVRGSTMIVTLDTANAAIADDEAHHLAVTEKWKNRCNGLSGEVLSMQSRAEKQFATYEARINNLNAELKQGLRGTRAENARKPFEPLQPDYSYLADEKLGLVAAEEANAAIEQDKYYHLKQLGTLEDRVLDLETALDQKAGEIGRAEHRGNTVDYIYDKCANYGRQFEALKAELAEARAEIAHLNTYRLEENAKLRAAIETAIADVDLDRIRDGLNKAIGED